MIKVNEAEHTILSRLYQPRIIQVPLEEAMGYVLAEEVSADRDFPPFDRVAMDGIALAFDDLTDNTIPVNDIQAAGDARKTLKPGTAMEVMTGAILPMGATTVVRYEDFDLKDGHAQLNVPVEDGKNIHWQGSDKKRLETVVHQHTQVNQAVVGILATVGKTDIRVYAPPKVCIVSTGDELVDVHQIPLPHQIRKSNVHTLQALCQNHGLRSAMVHLNDEEASITTALSKVLNDFDVVLLSGGVSKGKFDYVPAALETLGVAKHFHRVAQRPGKPFWFGTNNKTTVFAFPGNPVSTLVCAMRYFIPWLNASLKRPTYSEEAVLDQAIDFKPDLTYFLQVKTYWKDGSRMASPHPGNGSGDLANLGVIDGFIELEQGQVTYKKGSTFRYWPL